MYKPLAETNCQFIDTLDDLVALNEKLCKTTEFAVDLEVMMEVAYETHIKTIAEELTF